MCVNEGAKCLNKQHVIFICFTLRSVNTIRYTLRHYSISLKDTVTAQTLYLYLGVILKQNSMNSD